jgi:hypothetical protein
MATDGAVQRVVVKVTPRTRLIANGVTARVVRDTVTENGRLVEDTFDWYAQDRRGNVWYLGEDTRIYKNSALVSTEGSWEAGVDGATAGIVMPASPRVGMSYRQEYYKGHAEDRAKILSLGEQAEVPFGQFDRVLITKEWNPLEPKLLEYKLYARGVGPVLALTISGGSDREELVRFRRPGARHSRPTRSPNRTGGDAGYAACYRGAEERRVVNLATGPPRTGFSHCCCSRPAPPGSTCTSCGAEIEAGEVVMFTTPAPDDGRAWLVSHGSCSPRAASDSA